MDETYERKLQRQREWYRSLTEEQKERRRAQQREYRQKLRLARKDEINAYKRQNRAENRDAINARQRAYYEEHPEEFREYKRRSYEKHGDNERARARSYYDEHREQILRERAERRLQEPETQEWHERQAFFKQYPSARVAYYQHGSRLPWNEFAAMFLKARSGPCDICGVMKNGHRPRFYMDHRHADETYRGVLCQKCNSALGLLGDNIATVRRAMEYLIRTEETN